MNMALSPKAFVLTKYTKKIQSMKTGWVKRWHLK